MGIKQTAIVLGVKRFNGKVTNERTGQENHYNTTTLFVVMRMAPTDTTAGAVIVEQKWGTSDNFDKIEGWQRFV